MKKILLLGPFPINKEGITGQSIANETLYNGLKDKYNVDKINTYKNTGFENKEDQGKFKIKKFLKIMTNIFSEAKLIIKNKYDVIYMTPGQSFLGFLRFAPYMMCTFFLDKPCYIHIHGGNFRNMYNAQSKMRKKILEYFFKRIAGAIVLGESLKKMFVGLIDNKKIFVCENGVQDEIIATKKEIKEKKNKFFSEEKKKVLYLSNLMKEKGILEVLEVSKCFNENEIEFNLAGAIEPNIKEIVEKYLKEYPQKLFYHGIVNGVYKKKLLLDSDIFILPTYYSNEGQPISILEAYVNGCAVITDENIGGIKDIFKDSINGKNCKNRDRKSIYIAIKNILEKNEFIERNYEYGISKFSKDCFIERIEKIIIN